MKDGLKNIVWQILTMSQEKSNIFLRIFLIGYFKLQFRNKFELLWLKSKHWRFKIWIYF